MIALWTAALAAALTLPDSARMWLDRSHPGWKLAPAAPQIADWFRDYRLPYAPNLIRADFDGDGAADHAVQIVTRAGRQLVVLFLARGTKFDAAVLADDPPDPFTCLVLYRKGDRDFDFERMKPFRYADDSLGLLYFDRTAVTFSWRAGKIEKRAAPGDEEVEASRQQ